MTSDRQLRKNPRQLLLKFAQTAGVLYSVGRPRGLFGLCQLAGGALVERLVAAGARRARPGRPRRPRSRSSRRSCPPGPPRTAAASPPRAPCGGGSRRGLGVAPLGDPRAHARPQQALEEVALVVVGERVAGDRPRDPPARRARPRRPSAPPRRRAPRDRRRARGRPCRRRSSTPRGAPVPRAPRISLRRCRPSGRRTAAQSLFFGGGLPRRRRRSSARRPASARPGPRLDGRLVDLGASSTAAASSTGSSATARLDGRRPRLVDRRVRDGGLGGLRLGRVVLDHGRSLGEDVLGQAELRHVLEVAGVAGQALGATRQDLALDPLDREREPAALGVDLEDLDLDLVARLRRSRAGSRRAAGRARRCARALPRPRGSPRTRRTRRPWSPRPRARHPRGRCRRPAATDPPGSA